MESKKIKVILNENSLPVLIGLFILTAIFGYFLRVSPSMARLSEVRASIRSAEDSEKAKIQQILIGAKKNNEYFESLDRDLKGRFYTALPQKKDVPVIYAEIDSLVKQSGVNLESLDVVEVKPAKGKRSEVVEEDPDKPKQVAIGLKITGQSWPMVKNFLSNLESSLHLLDVLALTYNPKDNALSLNLRSYFLSSSQDDASSSEEE